MSPPSNSASVIGMAGQIANLYASNHLADITLKLLNTDGAELETIPSHSFLLRLYSCILNTKFETKLNGGEPPQEVKIILDESGSLPIKAYAVKIMLKSMYTGRVELTMESIVDVMAVGECMWVSLLRSPDKCPFHYQVTALSEHCRASLRFLLATHWEAAWDLLPQFCRIETDLFSPLLLGAREECLTAIVSQIESIGKWTGGEAETLSYSRMHCSLTFLTGTFFM